jgi:hypothetical protein
MISLKFYKGQDMDKSVKIKSLKTNRSDQLIGFTNLD